MTAPGDPVDDTPDDATETNSVDGESAPVTDEAIASLIDEQTAADNLASDNLASDNLASDATSAAGAPGEPISEEAVVALIAERDSYLDQLQRSKAEFANARRRADERLEAQRAQAAASLVEKLLPILDSCEAALGQGIEDVRPISDALFEMLSSQGLERVDALGEPFDPEVHEAVMYEAGEGEQTVIEILRTGYRWNDRVVRAAMVKVQG